MGKNKLYKTLALTGMISIAAPLCFMILTALNHTVKTGSFLMDYLIPGELAPLIIGGSLLITVSAFGLKHYRKLSALFTVLELAFLGGALSFAQVSGLASGAVGVSSWQFTTVLVLYFLYVMAFLGCWLFGLLILRSRQI